MVIESIPDGSGALTHVILIRLELWATDAHSSEHEVDLGQSMAIKRFALEAMGLMNERPTKDELLPKSTSMSLEQSLGLSLQRVVCKNEGLKLYSYIYLALSEPLVLEWDRWQSLKMKVSTLWERSMGKSSDAAMDEAQHLGLRTPEKMPATATTTMNLSRLSTISHLPGPEPSLQGQVHYVVETDVESGWWDEITQWYEEEHLPGLASVPGCVVAMRYLNLDEGPRSLACYDLVSEAVLTSKEWLAVRATDWSSKARPHFVNTKRDVYPQVLI